MSKKKTKTRIEKAVTHHDFSHLTATKTSASVVSSGREASSPAAGKSSHLSPLDALVGKDLRTGSILIASIIVIVIVLGVIVYQSHLLTPIFKHFGLSY